MPGGVGVQADLRAFTSQMRDSDKKFAASMKRNLRSAVTTAGGEILAEMKKRSSWSTGTQRPEGKDGSASPRTSIAEATSMSVSFAAKGTSIRIHTDKKKAPHARPLEMGNSTTFNPAVIEANGGFTVGRDGKRRATNKSVYAAMRKTNVGVGRELKHPVFGKKGNEKSWGWTSMALRPFFFASVEAKKPGIEKKFDDAMKQIARDALFKGV